MTTSSTTRRGSGAAADGNPTAAMVRELASAEVLGDADGLVRVAVPVDELEHAVHWLAGRVGSRFADLFASESSGEIVLRVLWALDADGVYVMLESPIAGEGYPSVSDIVPAAFLEECETYEQFGLRPAGDKPLNRVAVPPQTDRDVPRLGSAAHSSARDAHAPHAVGGHAFEFPFGPVRMAGSESLYYGLVTSGEEVVDLYLLTWHKYRGLEWRLRGMSPREALFLVERVEGLSAVAQAWAFASAVESALHITASAASCRTRAIALELERLYNHAAAVAALCQATGLSVGQADAEIALERLLRVNAAVFGHRYLFGVVDVGGVARTPDLVALRSDLPGAVAELRAVTDRLSMTNSFLDRLEAAGVLDAEQASRLGLVGPVARATGIEIDVRRQHPRPPYDVLRPENATRPSGDVFARYQVFLAEVDESVRLLDELVTDCGIDESARARADHSDASARPLPTGGGMGLGWAESPRGESLAFVALDEFGRVERARIRPASVRNWRAFDDACRSRNVFTDVPIIEASFWLTVAGAAR